VNPLPFGQLAFEFFLAYPQVRQTWFTRVPIALQQNIVFLTLSGMDKSGFALAMRFAHKRQVDANAKKKDLGEISTRRGVPVVS
jgi:hypothetical protein